MESERIEKQKIKNMKWPTFLLVFALSLMAVILGYNYFFEPLAFLSPSPTPNIVSQTNSTGPADLLTKEEKIAQLLALPIIASQGGEIQKPEVNFGFYTLFGSQIATASAQKTTTQLKNLAFKIKPLIAVDHEGGTTQRLSGSGFTALPSWQSLCSLEATRSAQILTTSAREIKNAGIDIVLAPVLDRAQSHPVLKSRICSDQSEVIEQRATEYLKILKSQNLLPVVKHFPGIGQTSLDLHQNFDRVLVATQEAQIYQTVLDQYPNMGVMVSHVGVKNQYPDIPCSLSDSCVGQLTANYPEALVFTDALEMKAAGFQTGQSSLKPLSKRAKEAILAGNQVLIFGPSVSEQDLIDLINTLAREYESSQVFKQKVDLAVTKILAVKQNQKL